ncbi:hypothetical protein E4631_22270 [Hymenobacter sp. UV11]|uniref:hypothetical protein n=1 Tax=Hymenobacter sp. UV11 TaxID=1849735 RepID=UPI00105FFAC4|nr:hypothetical protein [Hymenobacter sp. UV11]TDN38648.1 hypothetical protein A8B98_22700 [Hymenobacter sp. UV11]TFZ63562.1 hypothetical protein E4631_22270 [Hymenobacter sp. UV11]
MPFSDQRHEFTQAAIERRMRAHVQQLWGVNALEELDPFVRLMVQALARELHDIGDKFITAETGLLRRLAALLTPVPLAAPQPAHALVQVHPATPTAYLSPTESLFAYRRVASKPYGELDVNHNTFLSAVDTVKLFDGRIAWLAAGQRLYAGDPSPGSAKAGSPAFRTEPGRALPAYHIWLGLELHPALVSLDRLSFHFELPPALDHHPDYYSLLEFSEWAWAHNSQPLHAQPGPGYKLAPETNALLSDQDQNFQQEQVVKAAYHAQFMHLQWAAGMELPPASYPPEFEQVFPPAAAQALQPQPLLWVRVKLAAHFSEALLDQVQVRLNVVPMLNRRLHRLRYRTREMHNILPLPLGPRELFLAVQTLLDSQQRILANRSLQPGSAAGPGTYFVRQSGIERFDARDAREQLQALREVVRDEAVAFAAYGQDRVMLEAQRLNAQIDNLQRLLEQQEGSRAELPHYVIVAPHADADALEVRYWASDGALGNDVAAGTPLKSYDIFSLVNERTLLLTPTRGGRNRLEANDQLEAYRYALLSQNRVVTLEDVKAFVKARLGPLAQHIVIRKGYEVSLTPGQGLLRTVEVVITPASPATGLRTASAALDAQAWTMRCESLAAELRRHAGPLVPYRVLWTRDLPTTSS